MNTVFEIVAIVVILAVIVDAVREIYTDDCDFPEFEDQNIVDIDL